MVGVADGPEPLPRNHHDQEGGATETGEKIYLLKQTKKANNMNKNDFKIT